MNASVDQAHRLIGARLRDPQRRREGRIVGVDQTRETPALWVVWEGQPQAQRAELAHHDLHELVLTCVGSTASTDDSREAREEREAGEENQQATLAMPWRRTAGD